MKKISVILLCLISIVQMVHATAKSEADKAYQEERFEQAIKLYEEILATEGESAVIYYNLGNSYYKNKDIAKAVLNYERALLLNPGDADIRFNLDMAKGKTTDQITPTHEVFILTWAKALVNLMNESAWARLGIVSFILFLAGAVFYIFGNRIVVKKIGFITGLICLLLSLFANFCAFRQKSRLIDRTGAIIMAPTVSVKSTPNESGTDLFVLHEGTKVFVEDDSMKEWKEVRLEDGNKGWVKTESIELI